ncbi:MAG: integrin alpha, partial [Methylococcales bacterium]
MKRQRSKKKARNTPSRGRNPSALARALPHALAPRLCLAAGLPSSASLAYPFPADYKLSALHGSNGFRLAGVAAVDRSGISVSTAGDVNGDGVDDVLIGAFGAGFSGTSYVVFGGAGVGASGNLNLSTLDGSNGFRLSGVAARNYSGRSVSAAGDVNGDGVDDVLIGAFGA